MDLILFQHFESDQCLITSSALFSLVCCFQADYKELVEQLLQQQTDDIYRQRLTTAFNDLTNGVELKTNRQNRLLFRDKFEKFIVEVQGILCIK
ncbi:Uncharacterised protein g11366 [Pycnogonum litorale]